MTKSRSSGAKGTEAGERSSSERPRHTPSPASTPLRRADTLHAPVRGRPTVPAASGDPLLGSLVGAFRIVEELGRGGMGSVYLGQHVHIGSKVAIKFLHEALAADEELVQRFFSEARAVNVIGHENIVRIFDFGLLPPKRHYMVMEHLVGHELHAELGRPMSAADAVPVLVQVCEALEAAHRAGIVHRDLKPANIFLVKRAREERFVKVLDFGIAKLTEQTGGCARSAVGAIIGTPEYMAPEQALAAPVDGRSDLYSLGVIAYELLTGRLPFEATQAIKLLLAHAQEVPVAPHLVHPGVPPSLSAVVMRALEKKPSLRFQTARELSTALESALFAAMAMPEPATEGLGVGMFESAPSPDLSPLASPVPKIRPVTLPTRVPARSPDGGSEESGRFVARSQATPFAGTSSVTRSSFTGSSPSPATKSIAQWLESEVSGSADAASADSGRSATPAARSIAQWLESEVSGSGDAASASAGVAGGLADDFVVTSGAKGSDSGRSAPPSASAGVAGGLADGFVVTSGAKGSDSGRSPPPSASAGIAGGLADGFVVTSGVQGADSGRSAPPSSSPSGMVVTAGLQAAGAAPSVASSPSGRASASGMVVTAGLSSGDSGRTLATPSAGRASVERGAPSSDSGRSSPAPAREKPTFEAVVRTAQGQALGSFTCRDLTRAGLYVCTPEAPPPLRGQVVVALPQGSGLKLGAEVVHHVSVAQSASWGMPAGFAVQFANLTPSQREELDALVRGAPLPAPRAEEVDDPELVAVLNRYARAEDGDHYRVLGVALAEDFEPIRLRGLERKAELAALLDKHRDGRKGPALDAASKRLRAAIETLTRPALRLEYDVQRRNHPGVDTCLGSTLTLSEVEAIRRRFLEANPKAESEATVRSLMAKAFEQKRQLEKALQHHQEALEADPLHPESQKRYWALKRQLGG